MKKKAADQKNNSAQNVEPEICEDALGAPDSMPDFPFRLIKNENYRPPTEQKKRVVIEKDDLPPAA